MKRALLIFLLFTLAADAKPRWPVCRGKVTCKACTNCKYCKNCRKGTCGVCKKKIIDWAALQDRP